MAPPRWRHRFLAVRDQDLRLLSKDLGSRFRSITTVVNHLLIQVCKLVDITCITNSSQMISCTLKISLILTRKMLIHKGWNIMKTSSWIRKRWKAAHVAAERKPRDGPTLFSRDTRSLCSTIMGTSAAVTIMIYPEQHHNFILITWTHFRRKREILS